MRKIISTGAIASVYLLANHLIASLNLAAEATRYTGCFKKSFTTLKAYRNLYREQTRFELSKCSKTHRILCRIVMVQCDFH